MKRARGRLAPVLLAGTLALAGCAGGGLRTPTVESSPSSAGPVMPAESATPSVEGSASPGSTPGTATPVAPASTPPGGTPPAATVAASSCPTVNPIRVNRVDTSPQRVTDDRT